MRVNTARKMLPGLLLAVLCVPPVMAQERAGAKAAPAVAKQVRQIALDRDARARAIALWGRGFDTPIAIHDAASGGTWRWSGNAADGFTPSALPAGIPPANTCIELEGERTALLVLPLPEDDGELAPLIWHERSHCAQQTRGLADGREGGTAHLDGEQGRAWLRLELRALRAAARNDEPDVIHRHLAAALAFRARRDAVAPGAIAGEVAIERNEGLAESNGRTIASSGREALRTWLLEALAKGDTRDNYVRSAAYLTGPAYGFLLDALAPGWRRELPKEGDLAALAARKADLGPGTGGSAERLAKNYGSAAVFAAEHRREQVRHARELRLRARLIDGPVLQLPLSNPRISFNPNSLFPLGSDGTVYKPLTIITSWGRLQSDGEALLAADWSQVQVAAVDVEGCGRQWRGNGWKLELSDGWGLRRDTGKGLQLVEGAGEGCR